MAADGGRQYQLSGVPQSQTGRFGRYRIEFHIENDQLPKEAGPEKLFGGSSQAVYCHAFVATAGYGPLGRTPIPEPGNARDICATSFGKTPLYR
jgi:hypothetical protein